MFSHLILFTEDQSFMCMLLIWRRLMRNQNCKKKSFLYCPPKTKCTLLHSVVVRKYWSKVPGTVYCQLSALSYCLWSFHLLSFDFSILKSFLPDVSLKLFQCSCLAILTHLPQNTLNHCTNNLFSARNYKKKIWLCLCYSYLIFNFFTIRTLKFHLFRHFLGLGVGKACIICNYLLPSTFCYGHLIIFMEFAQYK